MPRKLWQWHRVTAVDDAGIIAVARGISLARFEHALAQVAAGPTVINTVEEAIDYIETHECGSVQNYDVIEIDGVTMEKPYDE